MVRHSPPPGPRLEALLDERDHLRIQISLAKDDPDTDPATIKAAEGRLWELEKQIDRGLGE
jgi:hypothetical protein